MHDYRNNIGSDKEPVQQDDVVHHFKTEERVWKMVQRIKLEKRILNLTFLLTNSKPLIPIIVFSSHYVVEYILNREVYRYFKVHSTLD